MQAQFVWEVYIGAELHAYHQQWKLGSLFVTSLLPLIIYNLSDILHSHCHEIYIWLFFCISFVICNVKSFHILLTFHMSPLKICLFIPLPSFFQCLGPYLLFLCALFFSFLCWSFLFILFGATPSGIRNSFLTLFQESGRAQRTIWGSRNQIWVCLVQDKCCVCYAIYLVPYYCSLQVIYIIWILALKKYLGHIVYLNFTKWHQFSVSPSFVYIPSFYHTVSKR